MNSSQRSKTASDVWAVQATCGEREPTVSSVPPCAAASTCGMGLSYSRISAGEHAYIYLEHIRADLMLPGSSQSRSSRAPEYPGLETSADLSPSMNDRG